MRMICRNMEGKSMNPELERILQLLKRLENEIRNEYKAEIIGVFGSYARGEQGRDSDVDILVRFLEGATLFDLVGLADFLEGELKLKMDVVSERAVRQELKDQILSEVVAV